MVGRISRNMACMCPPLTKVVEIGLCFFYGSHFVGGIMLRQTSIRSGYGPYKTKARDRLG